MIEHRNENEERHRVDGPAIVYEDGHCEWWVNGKLHLALTGSSFISLGTNWMVGVGVFFCLWSLAGMLKGDQ